MREHDEKLSIALQRLRDGSNPPPAQKARILAVLQSGGLLASEPTDFEPAVASLTRSGTMTRRVSAGPMSTRLLAWGGLALGLVLFAAGFGLGRRSVTSSPPGEPPDLPAAPLVVVTPALAVPPESTPAARLEAPPAELLEPTSATAKAGLARVARRSGASATGRAAPARQRPKARASSGTSLAPAPVTLSLAEALQLLQRSERAIYSGNPVWALSLLDELDARAPRALLREERVATRVLALCKEGRAADAQRLANEARGEAPASIYGGLLEGGCNTESTGAHTREP